jgi:hypothetical protein
MANVKGAESLITVCAAPQNGKHMEHEGQRMKGNTNYVL